MHHISRRYLGCMRLSGRRWVSGQVRYVAPAVVLVAVGVGAGVPAMSGASSPPSLPTLSVQQLVADVAQARAPQLSGTLTWAPDLGLSGLSTLEKELGGTSIGSSSGGGFNPLTLLTGPYEVKVWLGGPKEEHLALITGPDSEVDLVRNANQAWLWDSTTQRVEHFIGPATSPSASSPSSGSGAVVTPQQVAANILQNLSATTSVTEGEPLYVAGQPAYQLVLTPKEATTVSDISIAVGSSGPLLGVPLQVAVNAKGANAPALEFGFTGSLNLGAPASSEFTFVAPPGSTVVTHDIGSVPSQPQGLGWLPTSLGKSGTGWATVLHGKSSQLAGTTGQALFGAVATQVDVGGQQARLFTSYLLNVLVMPDGQFYAGFVAPSVLEAAASQGA